MDDLLAAICATCLERMEAGATLDECLAAYPAERAQLEPLLRVAARLQALPRPGPLPAAAQAALTGRVLGHLHAQRPGSTGAHPSPQRPAGPAPLDPSAALAGVLRALGYRGPLSRPWLRLGALALGLLLALILAATAYAAARAIFTPSPPAPAALAPATTFEFRGPIEAMSEAALVIAGVTVDLGPETVMTGTPAVGALAQASGQIRDDGTLLADQVAIEQAAAEPTLAPTAPPTLAPTAAPIAVATAAPPTAEPVAPTAEPTVAPPAPVAGPFNRLGELLVAGRADGRAGKDGDEFLKLLTEAEQAFAQGDAKKTRDKLRDLTKKLREAARKGEADVSFVEQTLILIVEIEVTYGLPGDSGGGGGGGGDDNDDEDGDDDD